MSKRRIENSDQDQRPSKRGPASFQPQALPSPTLQPSPLDLLRLEFKRDQAEMVKAFSTELRAIRAEMVTMNEKIDQLFESSHLIARGVGVVDNKVDVLKTSLLKKCGAQSYITTNAGYY